MKKLLIVASVSVIFIAVEVVGGLMANSIAILSDAAHLASDLIGFGISIAALAISQSKATKKYTFGFHRVEVMGALISIFSIWGMTIWLFVEATRRFYTEPEV